MADFDFRCKSIRSLALWGTSRFCQKIESKSKWFCKCILQVELHTTRADSYSIPVDLHTITVDLQTITVDLHTITVESLTTKVDSTFYCLLLLIFINVKKFNTNHLRTYLINYLFFIRNDFFFMPSSTKIAALNST